jgi:hypothetical protein
MGQSLSQRLTAYPEDLLSTPLNQAEVSFGLSLEEAAQPGAQLAREPFNPPAVETSEDIGFASLIRMFRLPLLLTALVAVLVWGTHLARARRLNRSR